MVLRINREPDQSVKATSEFDRPQMAALFDWDGTLFPKFTIFPWTKYLKDKKLFPSSLALHLDQLLLSYQASKLSHDELAVESAKAYAEGVFSVEITSLKRAAHEFAASPKGQLYPFAKSVLRRLQKAGIHNIVISGAPNEVLEAYMSDLPLHEVWGLEVANSSTPKPTINRALSREKKKVVDRCRKKYFIAFGFGNSLADFPLLESARVPMLMNYSPQSFSSAVRNRLITCTEHNVEGMVRNQTNRLLSLTPTN